MVDVGKVPNHIASGPLAMAVLDTRTARITAANQSYADLHGRSLSSTVGLQVHEYLEGDRLTAAQAVIDSIRQGWIDSLEGHVEFRRADGTHAAAYSWSAPLGSQAPHNSAIVGASPAGGDRRAGFEPYRVVPGRVILGALDHDWRFSDVALGTSPLLGWPAGGQGRARVQDIVHPGDAPALLASLGRAEVGQDVTVRARVRGAQGDWFAAFITVTPLGAPTSPRFGIAISLLDGPESGRESEREAWVATEVGDRLTSLPVGMPYADVTILTRRQNEILRRLAEGQRVEGIARDLFLSQSTVRNHLSIIYRRFGVGSQSQLIEKLRAQQQSAR